MCSLYNGGAVNNKHVFIAINCSRSVEPCMVIVYFPPTEICFHFLIELSEF